MSGARRAGHVALVGCLLVGVGVLAGWPALLGDPASWPTALDGDRRGRAPQVDAGNVTVPPDVAAVHRRGVTGSGVDVGVLDVTGFDADHRALTGHVAAARSFDDAAGVANGGTNRHGTAVALSVAELAPDASLHLAVAHSPGGVEDAAVWFRQREVDVVVAPFNALGAPDDGSDRVSAAFSRLREAGVVVVASAGNFAAGHWRGRLSPTGDGRHRFDDGVRNRVFPFPSSPRWPADADLWLTWNGTRFPHDLNLELYRLTRDGVDLVGTSRRVGTGDRRREHLGATLPAGEYFVVVDVPARTMPHVDASTPGEGSPSDDASRPIVEVTASGVVFDQARPAGSVAAPATARGVVAVGAVTPEGAVSPYSSRGPTTDGRPGVDVVAPTNSLAGVVALDTPGTSASAAYAGATAALIASANRSLSAAAIRRRLVATATDRGPDGPDAVTGRGRISPIAAVFDEAGTTPVADGDRSRRVDPGAESTAMRGIGSTRRSHPTSGPQTSSYRFRSVDAHVPP